MSSGGGGGGLGGALFFGSAPPATDAGCTAPPLAATSLSTKASVRDTLPSTGRRWEPSNALTFVVVLAPNSPSASVSRPAFVSRRCSVLTSRPLSPCLRVRSPSLKPRRLAAAPDTGTSKSNAASNVMRRTVVFTRARPLLLRVPAGLADGLAQKGGSAMRHKTAIRPREAETSQDGSPAPCRWRDKDSADH